MNCQEATVLVVDDDEVLRTCKAHVVISDIQMPDGDGIQLLKAIRERDPEIPIFFFLTGSNFTTEIAVSMGARQVFAKPFNRDDLIEEVLKSISEQKEL